MGLQASPVIVSSENATLKLQNARNGRNPGIVYRLSKVFSVKRGRIKGISKKALQQKVEEYGHRLEELEAVIQDKEEQIKLLQNELCGYSKDLTVNITGRNIIIGNENNQIDTDGDTYKLKDKLNSLIQKHNDEFNDVTKRHAELKWRMELTESLFSNIDAKLELILCTDDSNMKVLIEKITEVKSLVTKVKQDTITDEFIQEAADTMKYKTSDTVVPKLVRELAKCLAVKYAERPEKLYGAFGEIGNHPLGEIPTSAGLARACTHWLELWMKNKTSMDLVHKLRDLEESVIHEEAEKLRAKVQKRKKRWSGTSSNETTSDTDSDRGLIRIEFSNDDKSNRSVYYQHIVNARLEMKELSDTAQNTCQMSNTFL